MISEKTSADMMPEDAGYGKCPVDKISEFTKFGSILGLERISGLLERLGNPQNRLKVIHVAGTNGKGSVSRMIYSALRQEGYRTGIYSSPYLEVFNERIEIDGEYISDECLEEYTDTVWKAAKEMVDEGLPSPTEFDVVTAIGFLYFAEQETDYVVLEVGLGGRGDSTNVIEHPLLSVITSISLDHTDRLGDTIGAIAGEKAGIIKKGVPVVCGAHQKEATDVIAARAEELGAECIMPLAGKEPGYIIHSSGLDGSVFSTEVTGEKYDEIHVSMIGEHQVRNAVVALNCLELLRKKGTLEISQDSIIIGIRNAVNIGRFEVIGKDPYVVVDGAHNEDGITGFVKTVKDNFSGKRILVVSGMLKDKDCSGMLGRLSELSCDFAATEPDNPRKLPKEELAAMMRDRGMSVVGEFTPEEAAGMVREISAGSKLENGMRNDLYEAVIFAGSLYLIGEIRRRLLHEN